MTPPMMKGATQAAAPAMPAFLISERRSRPCDPRSGSPPFCAGFSGRPGLNGSPTVRPPRGLLSGPVAKPRCRRKRSHQSATRRGYLRQASERTGDHEGPCGAVPSPAVDDPPIDRSTARSIDLTFVPAHRPDLATIAVGSEALIVDDRADLPHLLSPTAALVWSFIDGVGSLDDFAADLTEVLGTDRRQIDRDVLAPPGGPGRLG